jgi:hypothetical protein
MPAVAQAESLEFLGPFETFQLLAQAEPDQLQQELEIAVQQQNWQRAIELVDQLIQLDPRRKPAYERYRTQLQQLARQASAFKAQPAPTPEVRSSAPTVTQPVVRQYSFTIDLRFVDQGLTDNQQRIIRTAARRWEQIITADLPDFLGDLEESLCSKELKRLTPDQLEGVDDLLIDVLLDSTDSGIFAARARPCALRNTDLRLPIYGVMQFKSTLLTPEAEKSGLLYKVSLHEIGHVLGLIPQNLADLRNPIDPVYRGARGVAEYNALGGQGPVPLENCEEFVDSPDFSDCLKGSGFGHWRTSVLTGELMSAYQSNPVISRVSLGALVDLGYTINFEAADPYRLPQAEGGSS